MWFNISNILGFEQNWKKHNENVIFWNDCMFVFTEPKTLAKNFSNGYLIGEVLHKYRLQTDFTMFTKKE